jgi:hypothetical protein
LLIAGTLITLGSVCNAIPGTSPQPHQVALTSPSDDGVRAVRGCVPWIYRAEENVDWSLKLSRLRGSPQKRVANLWTEFAAHASGALVANGKEPQNPSKLVVAATFEMAKT